MITLEEAHAIAEKHAKHVGAVWFDSDEHEIHERPTYWYFPYCFVGSSGLVICKSSGRVTQLGSAHQLDDWFWAYEQNFLAENVTLRILSVNDIEQTLAVLGGSVTSSHRWRHELRRWLRTQLHALPAEFHRQSLALAAPRFRVARERGWFEFELRLEESAT